MKQIVKLFAMMFVALVALGTAYASPINVESLNVEQVQNGDYVVLVTLENINASTGTASKLFFEIEELGTEKDMGFFEVGNDTVVESFTLQEVTDNFNSLKKGTTYTLTARTGDGSMLTTAFLFGSNRDTEGLDLIIEDVEVNNNDVTNLDSLQVLNGATLNIDVRFSALETFDDARLMVFIDGYEHASLVGSTDIFLAQEGVTYVKSMTLNLPADMDSQKEYRLRITGANDLSGLTYKELTLFVDTQRDRVDILDLVLTPSSGVEPGQNIIANVRMKNRGQQDQDSVKATVEIPRLGVSESSYISNLNPDEVATSDDMLIFVPEDAAPGQYEALVTLSYDDGYTRTTESFSLNILAPRTVQEQNLIVSYKENIELMAGEATSFDIVIGNPNDESKPISIATAGAAWADVDVTPGLAMVQGGADATYTVTVTPRDSVEGERSLTLIVKEGTDQVSELTVSTYVEAKVEEGLNITNIILAVFLVIAIIVLLILIVAIARRKNTEENETVEYDDANTSSEEYY